MTFKEDLLQAVKNYWKIIFLIVYPLLILPVILLEDKLSNRCIYVLGIMVAFWLFEILPFAITSLMPVAFFPLLSILSTKKTTACYMSETTAVFVGSYLLALAIQESTLHQRISLNILRLIGFGPKKLHIFFTCVALLLSIGVSSIVSTALMIPIVYHTLTELEEENICQIYEEGSLEEDEAGYYEDERIPSKFTMGLFISLAYASTIGGTGYFTSENSNSKFHDIYEGTTGKDLSSLTWIALSFPYMIITVSLTILWIQIQYMGLFRPNSIDARNIQGIQDEGNNNALAEDHIKEKLQNMGPITFHELAVSICAIVAIILWCSKEPYRIPESICTLLMEPATAAMLVIIILFLVPRFPICCNVFSSDEEKIPQTNSQGLLMWKFAVKKVPWMIFFLIGAPTVIAEGARKSKLSSEISHGLEIFQTYSDLERFTLLPLIAACMTQLANKGDIVKVIMPALSRVSLSVGVHPIYIMLPAYYGASFAYLLPVSAVPNAMVADLIHMSPLEMVKVGIVVLIISYLVVLGLSTVVLLEE